MPRSDQLVDRIRGQLGAQKGLEERRVMDGVGFFVGDRMAVSVVADEMCLPVSQKGYADYVREEGVGPFLFAGRPVPGWIVITGAGLDDEALARWVEVGLSGLDP